MGMKAFLATQASLLHIFSTNGRYGKAYKIITRNTQGRVTGM